MGKALRRQLDVYGEVLTPIQTGKCPDSLTRYTSLPATAPAHRARPLQEPAKADGDFAQVLWGGRGGGVVCVLDSRWVLA
jgi:hypothetical protein